MAADVVNQGLHLAPLYLLQSSISHRLKAHMYLQNDPAADIVRAHDL